MSSTRDVRIQNLWGNWTEIHRVPILAVLAITKSMADWMALNNKYVFPTVPGVGRGGGGPRSRPQMRTHFLVCS